MKIDKRTPTAYDKSHSFLNFKSKQSQDVTSLVLNKIKKVLSNKEKVNELSKKQKEIIKYLKSDLYLNTNSDRVRFKLTPNISKEISLLHEKDILRYLIHRYRYDIYPIMNIMDDYPPYLQIEPTSFCNYRCVFCFQSNKSFSKKSSGYMGHMELDTFKRIVDQAEGNIEFISLASRGEPMVARKIEKMLEYASGKFLNLKINTNASVLDEKKCHSILSNDVRTLVFSADAASENLYKKLRVNGELNKVLSNIKLFKKIKENYYPKSKIITRVSGVKVSKAQNFKSMEKFWGELVDQVAFVDYCPWENVYVTKKNKLSKPCSELWRRMYVWWDGKTNPCEVDYKSKLSAGNIFNSNISKIWKSKNYNSLRKKHLLGNRSEIDPCNKCFSV